MKQRVTAAVVLLVFLTGFCFAQAAGHHDQNPNDPFRLQKLTDSLYVLYGRGGNIGFLIGPESVLVVDSQYRNLAPGIIEKIKSVTDKPIRYLINTHHHPDHVGGNESFLPFALILAHDNVRKRMLESPAVIMKEYPAELEKAEKEGNQKAIDFYKEQIEWAKKIRVEEIAAPFLTFDSEFRIYLGQEKVEVWHAPPAHTDGDAVVYFEKEKVIHMGDLLFNKVIPFIDIEGGGSVRGYIATYDKLLSRLPADITAIAGHGETTNLAGLKVFRQYIQDLLDLASKAHAQGKSKEQFVKEADLPAYKDWDGYKDRFQENAASAYDETK
jgi:glyoxylase-like metal-dependent hydrolase (beta-lactamase superfamily II)